MKNACLTEQLPNTFVVTMCMFPSTGFMRAYLIDPREEGHESAENSSTNAGYVDKGAL